MILLADQMHIYFCVTKKSCNWILIALAPLNCWSFNNKDLLIWRDHYPGICGAGTKFKW